MAIFDDLQKSLAIFGNIRQSKAIKSNPDNQKLSFFPLDWIWIKPSCTNTCQTILSRKTLEHGVSNMHHVIDWQISSICLLLSIEALILRLTGNGPCHTGETVFDHGYLRWDLAPFYLQVACAHLHIRCQWWYQSWWKTQQMKNMRNLGHRDHVHHHDQTFCGTQHRIMHGIRGKPESYQEPTTTIDDVARIQ